MGTAAILSAPEHSCTGKWWTARSRTTQEISRADVLLVLGTSLRSDVYSHYIRYFQGKKMIIIHRLPRPLDERADMVVYDLPQNVLPLLVGEGNL